VEKGGAHRRADERLDRVRQGSAEEKEGGGGKSIEEGGGTWGQNVGQVKGSASIFFLSRERGKNTREQQGGEKKGGGGGENRGWENECFRNFTQKRAVSKRKKDTRQEKNGFSKD